MFRFGGEVSVYQPAAISEPGATSENACLPEFTATEDGSWKLPADIGLINVTAMDKSIDTMEKCAAACAGGQFAAACQFVSYDYLTRTCYLRQAAAGSAR
jgi:hypothetical protein